MSRKSKLQHQYIMELKKECKFGQSKNQAKQKAREQSAQTNEKFKQVKGIYSYKSYNEMVTI